MNWVSLQRNGRQNTLRFRDHGKPTGLNYQHISSMIQGMDGKTYYVAKDISRIDLREKVYDFPRQNVITKDNVTISINALLYFQIVDPKSAVYEIQNLPDAIEKLTQTTLRNLVGQIDLDETLVSRDKINQELRTILDEATDKWGVKVTRVELQDIIPPVEIQTAMEKQMKAERDRRAAILEAEGLKKSAILKAEGEKESAINIAEGVKQSAILKAEGVAQARIVEADGKHQHNSQKEVINHERPEKRRETRRHPPSSIHEKRPGFCRKSRTRNRRPLRSPSPEKRSERQVL